MPNHAPRLSLPYVDLSGLCALWAEDCLQVIVYEHEADEGCATTHCHFLMIGCQVKEEALRRKFYKALPQFKELKGNALWSWEHSAWKKANPGKDYDLGLIAYGSKGHLRPKYVKNIPDTIVEEHRATWVEPTSKGVKSSDDKYDEYRHICDDFFKEDWQTMTINLSLIRSWTMRWYWKRDGRLPNAGCYKRNAASLFLKLAEKRELEDPHSKPFCVALEEVKDLWY